jgi:putative transposase
VERPRTPEATRAFVLKVAGETGWGYTRIQTVVNILNQAGLDTEPKRGAGSWDELLKRQAEMLWQCDFFSKRILSKFGMPQVCALVFLNVATRRVWVSPVTKTRTGVWVTKQVQAGFVDVRSVRIHRLVARIRYQLQARENRRRLVRCQKPPSQLMPTVAS